MEVFNKTNRILIGLLFALCAVNSAWACRCAPHPPLEQRFNEAQYVYYAKISSLDCQYPWPMFVDEPFEIGINLEVTEILKGEPEPTLTAKGRVRHCDQEKYPPNSAACETRYVVGQEYLFFQSSDKPPSMSACRSQYMEAEKVPGIELQEIINRINGWEQPDSLR